MKKLFSALLAAIMVLSAVMLPACNPVEETPDQTQPSAVSPTNPTNPTDATDPTKAPTDPTDPTDPPATEPPATEPPATEPPATEPPATEPPATEPPATEPPATEPPATEPPATEPPATEPPATEPPATEPPATEPPTEPSPINILGPVGEVYPYVDQALEYLTKGGDVGKYTYPPSKNAAKAIEITWECDFVPSRFTVRYGTDSTFANCKEVAVSGSKNYLRVYNLLKAATYYVQVSATDDSGETFTAESTFTTTSMGPRVMNIEGLMNVRDVGGYQTSFGVTTVQNLLFRGDALVKCDGGYSSLTYEGKKLMSEELGIKLEIDVRIPSQSNYDGDTSIIPGAALKYCSLGGYAEAFSTSISGYRQVFKELAVPENYPIYLHCTGGADRTGTVVYLLNALLGVDEKELIQDYEFTSFCGYGTRSTKSGTYRSHYMQFKAGLNEYEGDTLTEKVENYLIKIGVTRAEIESIRGIMFGEIPVPGVTGY